MICMSSNDPDLCAELRERIECLDAIVDKMAVESRRSDEIDTYIACCLQPILLTDIYTDLCSKRALCLMCTTFWFFDIPQYLLCTPHYTIWLPALDYQCILHSPILPGKRKKDETGSGFLAQDPPRPDGFWPVDPTRPSPWVFWSNNWEKNSSTIAYM